MSGTMVIGLEDPGRGAQSAGAATIWALRRRDLDVSLVTWRGEATRLCDRWNGADLVILIDEAATPGPPGRVRRRSLRHPGAAGGAAPGAHAQLVRDAMNLSVAFGRLPSTLLLYIVDGKASATVEALAAEIADEVTRRLAPRPRSEPSSWSRPNRYFGPDPAGRDGGVS